MGTNFFGPVYCTAALLSLLEESAPSHVVNVTSIAGRLSFGRSSAYCSSKFALVGWSEAVHYDLRAKGVYVSSVEPGPIPTEGFPQTSLIEHPILRGALSSAGDVSRAVQGVIKSKKMQRAVPRWYYLLQLPRLLCPPLYRLAVRKFAIPNARGD
jgi:short-subunit dehydrogenase